jgi:Ca2+-binding RTX toxin-like protein
VATYQFSALSDGQSISFNPNADILNFDQTSIAGADVSAATEGANLRISVGDKDVLLTNVSLLQLATTNLTFANGSEFLVGDNTTGTANDNAANTLTGTAGNDHLDGLGGNDTMNGGAGNDTYVVNPGDVISDSGGVDTVIASASFALPSAIENITYVGTANTNSVGNSLANVMIGNAASNTLDGRDGNDSLVGGAGTDSLTGGNGNDTLSGGAGFDTLTGGAGNDQFLFDVAPSAANADRIADFVSATDKIVLDGTVHLNSGPSGNFAAGDARFFAAAGATGGHDADDRVIYDTSTGNLWYDADGNGSGAAQRIGTLAGAPTLVATDIAIVNGSSGGGGAGQHIVGTSGNDSLVGGPGDDTIEGLAGNDTLVGNGGNDSLLGGDGADSVVGGDGNDTLSGGFNATLDGGLGDDVYLAGSGQTIVDAGGHDEIITADTNMGPLPAGIEDLILRGQMFDAVGIGNELNNVIRNEGPTAFGHLDGGDGNDTLIGGPGTSNQFQFFAGSGNIGDNVVDGGAGSFGILNVGGFSGVVADFHTGMVTGGGNGGSGSVSFTNIQEIDGGNFDDRLIADDAGRSLGGGSGSDTLIGGAGNDTMTFIASSNTHGTDSIDGGGGVDKLVADSGDTAFTIDLAAGTLSSANGSATLANIENAIGGRLGDTISGTSGTNILQGDLGDDLLVGRDGADSLDGGAGNDTLDGGTGNDTLIGEDGEFSFGANLLTGGDGADSLVGGGGNDTLDGGAGFDTLVSGSGADEFLFTVAPSAANADRIFDFTSGSDKIALDATVHPNAGASGNFAAGDARFFAAAGATGGHDADDRVIYDTSTGNLWYDADGNGSGAAQRIGTLTGAPTLVATDITIVNGGGGGGSTITGTSGDDNLVGASGDDTILGLDGNDTLQGLAGNDSLDGGPGSDTMLGGDGNDTIQSDGAESVDGGAGVDTEIMPWGFAGAGIENIIVSGYSSSLQAEADGNELNNLITDEGPGNIFLSGGAGDDTIIGGAGSNYFLLSGGSGSAAYGFDSIDGGGGDDWLLIEGPGATVDFRNGTVTGGGESAADHAVFVNVGSAQGATGNDLMFASDSGNRLDGDGGADTLNGGAGNDTLDGDEGFDHPSFLPGNDLIFGNGGADGLAGDEGNDTLSGGTGFDTLTGGDGADTFLFDVAPGAANADRITDMVSGTDKIMLDGNFHPSSGASGNFAAGDARFFAAAGATGGHDADDRVVYDTSTGNLWYDADGSGSGAAQRIATLAGAPTLVATDIAIVNGSGGGGGGGGGGATITGTSGNDSLTGTAGNDTIDGLGGADTMNGLGGDDLYFVTAGDVIQDSGGNDTISAGASFALPSGIENIVYTGTANTSSVGNSLANSMTGNSGNNYMEGRGGADTLAGGAGHDTLVGGTEGDFFVFGESGAANSDSITDFVSGTDHIAFDDAGFTAIGATGNFASGDARFFAGAGATSGHDATDRVVYDTTTGNLYYDADGNGGGAAQLVATLTGHPAVAATDLTVT